MSLKQLDDVLIHGLKDLLSAEKQFRQALPKLAKAAEDEELTRVFEDHQAETENQIMRLEQCFELLGRASRSEKCEAASGLTKEGEEVIEEDGEAPAKDVMLTAAGRKTEHYEIASYEDAVNWARTLGESKVVDLLEATLAEERAAAGKLERIGKRLAKPATAGAATQ